MTRPSGNLEQSPASKLGCRLAKDGGSPSRKAVPTVARVDAGREGSLTCKLDSRLATDGGCPSRKAVPTDARVDAGEEEILTGRATPGEGPTGGRLSFQKGSDDITYGGLNIKPL